MRRILISSPRPARIRPVKAPFVAGLMDAVSQRHPKLRLVIVEEGVMTVTTHGLDDSRFQRDSFLPERRNQWVAGAESDRTISIRIPRAA